MTRTALIAGALAPALLLATAAGATTYDITIHGTVNNVPVGGNASLLGADVTLHATFTDLYIIDNGPNLTGYTAAQTDLFTGPSFHGTWAPYTVTLGPWSWGAATDIRGTPIVLYDDNPATQRVVFRSPNVTFTPYGVVKVGITALQGNFGITPQKPEFDANVLPEPTFLFWTQARGGPVLNYTGTWDLANAVVLTDGVQLSAAPEPSTWGLMIAGFGLVGAAMRRRRQDDQTSVNA